MIQFLYSKVAFILLIIAPACASGYLYEHFSYGYFTHIHILTVNPEKHTIMPVKASGEVVCRETVATLANRYGAVAAINGGFWKSDGSPAGALKINQQWFGTPPKARGAIGWSTFNHKTIIGRISTNYSLTECPFDSQIEVIPVSDPFHTNSEEWNELEHIVGGAPVLIQKGNLIQDFSPEQTRRSFLVNKHPRTAIGIKDNGDWVFVVVDGYFYGIFGGMTMPELSQFMLDLGCVNALNLDGGGSSTMVVEGRVINEPCGKTEENGKYVEAVSDAILIF